MKRYIILLIISVVFDLYLSIIASFSGLNAFNRYKILMYHVDNSKYEKLFEVAKDLKNKSYNDGLIEDTIISVYALKKGKFEIYNEVESKNNQSIKFGKLESYYKTHNKLKIKLTPKTDIFLRFTMKSDLILILNDKNQVSIKQKLFKWKQKYRKYKLNNEFVLMIKKRYKGNLNLDDFRVTQ